MTGRPARRAGTAAWRRRLVRILLAAALAAPVGAGAADPFDALIRQARQTIAAGRADLAVDTLQRALMAKPDDAEALRLTVVAAAATGDRDGAAEALARLRTAHPNDSARIAAAERAIATEGRDGGADALPPGVAEARAAAAAGDHNRAAELYSQSFGQDVGRLPVALQREYFETLAGTETRYAEAVAGLRRLVSETNDPAAELALARVLTYRAEGRREGLDLLEALAEGSSGDAGVRDAWRNALGWLAAKEGDVGRYDRYLARYPDDPVVRRVRLDAAQRLAAAAKPATLAPADAGAELRARGFRALEHGRLDAARDAFEQALRRDRRDRDALGGLGLVSLRQEDFAAAEDMLIRAGFGSAKARARWAKALASARFWRRHHAAAAALAAGDAARAAELARGLTEEGGPDAVAAWRLLGAAQLAMSRPEAAEIAYRGALRLAPRDSGAERGVYHALLAQGRRSDAQAHFERISAAARSGIGSPDAEAASALREEAARANAAGDIRAADSAYRRALALAPADPWLRLDFARFLRAHGQAASAEGLMAGLARAPDPTPDMLHAVAIDGAEQGRREDALAALDRIPAARRTPEIRAFAHRLSLEAAVARARESAPGAGLPLLRTEAGRGDVAAGLLLADALAGEGDLDGATAALAQLAERDDLDAGQRAAYRAARRRVIVAQARRLTDAGAYQEAEAHLAPALNEAPDDRQTLDLLATIDAGLGRPREALAVRERLLADAPRDLDALRATGGAALQAGETDRAGALAAAAVEAHPQAPEAHLLAGDAARAAGAFAAARQAYGRARTFQDQATRLSPDALDAAIARRLDDMKPKVGHMAEARAGFRLRDGDKGFDRVAEINGAAIYAQDREGLGRITLQATPVTISADSPGTGEANLRRFGANAIRTAGTTLDPGEVDASGVGFSAGFANETIQADIGVSPLGFRRVNPVGGVTAAIEPTPGLRLALTGEQRAVTDSVLSYSGARDPVTGDVFGGVVRRGARLAASLDRGRYGVYGSAGYYALVGKNVESNSRVEAGAGAYVRLIDWKDERLTVGGDLTYFGYDKNLRHFTTGHGGYFSPQRFFALSAPVAYEREAGRFSYRIGGAIGVTYFQEDDADVFPDSAALSAILADQLAADALGGTALLLHPGDKETGVGFRAEGEIEYAITDLTRIGLSLRLDGSADWYEGAGYIFLKQSFGDPDGR